jgi:hypothetical protein
LKKTFQLRPEGKHPERVLEAIKHEIRKYLLRERRKPLPKGADYWDFDCRVGATAETAEVVPIGSLTEQINTIAADEAATQFYVELLAKTGKRVSDTPVITYAPE